MSCSKGAKVYRGLSWQYNCHFNGCRYQSSRIHGNVHVGADWLVLSLCLTAILHFYWELHRLVGTLCLIELVLLWGCSQDRTSVRYSPHRILYCQTSPFANNSSLSKIARFRLWSSSLTWSSWSFKFIGWPKMQQAIYRGWNIPKFT